MGSRRFRRDRPSGILLLRGRCHSLVVVPLGAERVRCDGPSLGELSGGNWMTDLSDGHPFAGVLARSPVGRAVFPNQKAPSQPWCTTNFRPLRGFQAAVFPVKRSDLFRGTRACKIVTWLILPVVICLSQRLSHACLSISTCTVKLRMAH